MISAMVLSMIALGRRAVFQLLVGFIALGIADASSHPYTGIVDRNIFGLKPPPPPVVETNQVQVTPAAKVILTGITSMFGPQSKRAFFEITEQEPGKQPATPKRPILGEGDREGDIEVLSIDIEQNIVRIRNRSVESELTFEVPKAGATTGAANMAANPPVINPPASPTAGPGQPTIISSSEPRGGVTMFGGGGNAPGNSGGSVSTFGGAMPLASAAPIPGGYNPSAHNPSAYNASPAYSGGVSSFGGGGLPTIPNRTIRPPNPGAQNQSPPIDRDTQAILMEANRIKYESSGIPVPPLPQTHLSDMMQSGPPAPPGLPRR